MAASAGSNMERPAFQRLLADVDAGNVDVIVVYKVDRLSRSLLDFARVMDRFQPSRRRLRERHAELLDGGRDGAGSRSTC